MKHDARARLEDLLDREIEAARALSTTLVAERSALVGDSPSAVQAQAEAKTQLLARIEALETQRRNLWNDQDGAAPAASIAERWDTLMNLLAGCRTANEVNGYIIHTRQNQVRQLIDIVRGGPPMTYGRQGKTSATALRALARA